MTARLISASEAWAHPELGFAEPCPLRDRGCWWSLNVAAQGRLVQRMYRRRQYEDVTARYRGQPDVYVSQGLFHAATRGSDSVKWLTHAWVDLDVYRSETLRDRPVAAVVTAVLERCAAAGIPPPSYTVYSGRGVYLKWTFAAPVPGLARTRAVAVNRALQKRFADFGADPQATDAARILRLVGSVNGKTGEHVRVVHRDEDAAGRISLHDFDTLARSLLPYSPEEVRAFRRRRPADGQRRDGDGGAAHSRPGKAGRQVAGTGRGLYTGWHRRVLRDLATLARLRWGGHGVPRGWRDRFGFLAAVQLAHLVPAGRLESELQAWAGTILPADFVRHQLPRYVKPVRERAARAGDRVARGGQAGTPVYTYSKSRLREMLDVQPDEEPHLEVLIGDAERRRRERDRKRATRRAHGVRPRDERTRDREAAADARAREIARLRAAWWTWRAIADRLGMSPGAARACLARARTRWDHSPRDGGAAAA